MDPLRTALALDVGGANVKAAHSGGAVVHRPFHLWKNPTRLAPTLASVLRRLPRADALAVTMTGELCDCFATKRQGVHAILAAVAAVAGRVPLWVWTNEGCLVDLPTAQDVPLQVAAANWLALATFAGRLLPNGAGAVIDVGTTTTDIIPLRDGKPVPRGRTDTERLRFRELVYTGIRRTPVCALLGSAGAAELFATTQDVYLVLGMVAEHPTSDGTADGRPATREAAHARLARMLCADSEMCPPADTDRLARNIHERQIQLIRQALDEASPVGADGAVRRVVLAGSGEFLARAALNVNPPFSISRIISFAGEFGPPASEAACAFALAQLAMEMDGSSALP
jgi:probable H4MPT-linked C1 transfer pathway protein